MNKRRDMLRLGYSLSSQGSYRAGWRHEGAWNDGLNIREWQSVVRSAERGRLHFLFFADGAAVRVEARDVDALSFTSKIDMLEPLTLISSLATTSEKIGFVATASTSFNQPYTVARMFASLDYISNGRVGWNAVTSWSENEAKNFNLDKHLDHSLRYRRAEEFVDVVKGLWDSWDDDAFLRDKASGRYFDPAKAHQLGHMGEFFSVRGPLNISRPIQGHPVVAQAGASVPGMNLAARTADIVYAAQSSLPEAKAYYEAVKSRLSAFGRSRDSVLIFPGLMPIIGESDQEAQEKVTQLGELLHPLIGFGMLQKYFGDLSHYDPDSPLPPVAAETNGITSIRDALIERARKENLTLKQMYQSMAMASGHLVVAGTPKTICDTMQEWFESEACDGFAVHAAVMPADVDVFVDKIVPELQCRGLFRTEYVDGTLRDNLGLARPALRQQQLAEAVAS